MALFSQLIYFLVSFHLCHCLVICISVGCIRGSMIGSYPCTDEGIYAYHSMIVNHTINTQHQLPDSGYLSLYPII